MNDLLGELEPTKTVLLLDIDGVLAPIVEDPEEAAVPAATLELLAAAARNCALVACVTGRSLEQALGLVPLEGIAIQAAHGMHSRDAEGNEHVDPVAVAARAQLDIACTLGHTVGWRFEDKGLSVTYHFRHAGDPAASARQMRAQISTVLDPRIVEVVDARMALEVRPRGARTKGDAVRSLLAVAPAAASTAIYVGDDTTDVDAFIALADSQLRPVRVAVNSPEAPSALLEQADLVLDDQSQVERLLAAFAG